MIRLAATLTVLFCLFACAAAPAQPAPGDGKPLNVVFFLVDDYGWKDVGYNGSSFYQTPNIDKLAASGMVFTDGYAACPVCSPTRAAIMAGKNPARMDTTDWFGAPQPEGILRSIEVGRENRWTQKPIIPAPYVNHLPLEEVTLAEAFKANGYATFFCGKWHLGPNEAYYPDKQGFDINMGGFHRGGPYGGGRYFAPFDGMPNLTGQPGDHLPARLAEETSKFIIEHKDEPFLAYFSFYSVHTPLMGRPDLVAKYEEIKTRMRIAGPIFGPEGDSQVRLVQEHAVYAAMVEAMDEAVGKVLDTLEKEGLADNTIIVFTADNGGLSTSEGSPTSNYPLRAGKGWLYEGGIREPTIVRWPGHTAPGSVSDEPVISHDFYPTLLAAAGLEMMPEQHIDGVSLVPVLNGSADDLGREALYWHYPHYGNQGGSPGSVVRAGDWKLIEWFEPDKGIELFNLADDIGEQNNLAQQHPEKVKELYAMLEAWRAEVDAKLPTVNPKAE